RARRWSRRRGGAATGPAGSERAAVGPAHARDWNKYDDRLMKAAERGDVEKVSSILAKKGVTPTKLDVEGRSAFHVVASKGNLDCLNTLLLQGADITATDAAGRNALHLAAKYGHALCLQKLLQYNCPTENVDLQGRTALHDAGKSVASWWKLKANVDGPAVSSKERITNTHTDVLMFQYQVSRLSQKWNRLHAQEEANAQELELENQDLKDRMREVQEEQRMLLDRINGLQLQLNEEQMFADDLENEKDELKKMLSSKEKQQEESLRTIEALKAKLKYYEVRQLIGRKEELLLKQGQVFAVESQSKSMLRPLELSLPNQSSSSEKEALKRELDNVRTCYGAAKEEISKLQRELSRKATECKALASEYERTKEESDGQIKQLEDALKDVQKRMFESEGKVKQMQTHFLALKDHLTNEAASGSSKLAEELKDQLKEMKAKYEGASAEVGKLRNQIKQNELLVAEFKRDEGRLVEENKRLQKELGKLEMERDTGERNITELEKRLKETAEKLAHSVSAEKFENMKSLLSNEVNEKAKKLVEMEGKHEKLEAEICLLRRESESQKAELIQHVKPEEHERMRSRFEQKTEELEKTISELLQKNRSLQREVDKVQVDNKMLKQQIQMINTEIKSQNVPLKVHEELKKTNELTIDDLTRKVSEITKKYNESKGEAEKLLEEKNSLSENLSHLQAAYLSPEQHKKEVEALQASGLELEKQLAELNKKYEDEQAKVCKLVSENTTVKEALRDQYVSVTTHEEVKTVLNNTLEKTNAELSDLKGKTEDIKKEFMKVNEENATLKNQVKLLQNQLQTEYISLRDHESKVNTLNKSVKELQENNIEIMAGYKRGQEEILQLHAEIEAQKKELDTIQECIKSKYAPVVSFKEKEQNFEATVRELKEQLLEQTQRCRESEEESRKYQQENEKLKSGILSVQNDLQQNYILAEKSHEMEKMFTSKMEELNKQLRELLQKYTGKKAEEEELQEGTERALAAQARGESRQPPVGQFEGLKKALGNTVEDLKEAFRREKECFDRETLKVGELQQELSDLKSSSVPLAEYMQMKETLEQEIVAVKKSLKEKEEENDVKAEEVVKLQCEVEAARRALAELESKEVIDVAEYESMKSNLEAQVNSIAENLFSVNRKYEEACEEALQAKKSELSLKGEKELLQLRSCSIEQEIKDQKERCDKSLTTIIELQKRIQESAKQVEAKDNKITELLNDVERLKQALNGLSQLTYTSGIPSKRQNQQVEMLQNQVQMLQQQLADAKRQHQEVISVYRTHLLSAVQGHMDEDVQAALLQIIRMRQGLVC
uniref:Uveal autoantigen with coiled-coil domains and ankyrin repeats n=1 Tax=Nothoprocta perdicaria TaxID=30464 RepID=A0A8C6Z9X5_NOTPE